MRKLSVPRGGGEKLGVLSFEVAALMSRAASLWRALGDAPLARLRGEAIRLEGVRRLVADDDAALLALAVAEVAAACRDVARAVARLAAHRCADPLLRRFDALFAALVVASGAGGGGDRHGLRYAAAKKMDRKARKMQRLVAATAHLGHELDVLAELEQGLQRRGNGRGGSGGRASDEAAGRVARQRQEVDRLRAASLWNRTFDYAIRLLARSLFTIVARIVDVFDLADPVNNNSAFSYSTSVSVSGDDDGEAASNKVVTSRVSWSSSFVGGSSTQSTVYPSDVTAPRMVRAKSVKLIGGDARRFLLSRSRSLKQQLRWPAAGKHLVGCVVGGRSKSPPVRNEEWVRHGYGDPPLSFSYVSATSNDDDYSSSTNFQFPFRADHHHSNSKLSASVLFQSSHDALTSSAPATTLGGAGLALRYANLIVLIERLAAGPPYHHICSDERDELYGMLTDRLRAALRSCLRPMMTRWSYDPVLAAEWEDMVQRTLGWLAPLARNMIRWQAERNFEQRNVASSGSVLLLQTLHFADQRKTEAAVTELLVGLNYLWRCGKELEAKDRVLEYY